MPLPTPPPALANSLVVLEYTVAGKRLHINLHLQNVGAEVNTAGLPDRNYADPNSLLWGLFEPTGAENLVSETVTNFLTPILPLYDPDVAFNIKSLWTRSSLDVPGTTPLIEVFPTPAISGQVGSAAADSSPTSDEPTCFYQKILTSRSSKGGRFRVTLVGATPLALAKPRPITPDSGGDAYQKLAAYLLKPECRILGHDGGKPNGAFMLHSGPSSKIRRSQNFA